jgi:hypothetical protein
VKRSRWLTQGVQRKRPVISRVVFAQVLDRRTHSAAVDGSTPGFLLVIASSHCSPGHCERLRLASYGLAGRSQDEVEFMSGLAMHYAGDVCERGGGFVAVSSARHGRGRSIVTDLADARHRTLGDKPSPPSVTWHPTASRRAEDCSVSPQTGSCVAK